VASILLSLSSLPTQFLNKQVEEDIVKRDLGSEEELSKSRRKKAFEVACLLTPKIDFPKI
jgi:hypothetical protein